MTVVKYENNSYKMFSDPSITSFSERKETKGLEDTWRIFTKNISVCMIYVDIYFSTSNLDRQIYGKQEIVFLKYLPS